ncbi:fungal-specific transcription factor domain-containing protein [Xylariaceae sp. FL1651]|nr:fungal-specific transcription factor domain-containing protein [Xylariaceae sp. FL1651]
MAGNSSDKQKDQTSTKTAQACNHCRQRKSRCDGKTPCSFCEKRAFECLYETFQRRRGPGRSKEYIRALEARLRDTNLTLTEPVSLQSGQAKSTKAPSLEPTALAATSDSNELTAIAGGSADHALKAPGPELVSSDTWRQTAGVEEEISDTTPQPPPKLSSTVTNNSHRLMTCLKDLKPSFSEDDCRPQLFSSLVSANEIIKFLEPVFDDINTGYPFLSWPLFIENLSHLDQTKNPAWRALLNSVMAIGMLFRPADSDFVSSARHAWAKFNNAYALLPQLITLDPDILVIEAILSMAIFMKMSTDTRTAAQLVSSAVKMYQMAALQNDPSRTLGTSDSRYRRAFWTAYILDTEVNTLCGLPPAIDDDEFGVVADRRVMKVHMQDLSPVLQIRSEIAIMESIIYKRLYQRKALGQLDSELVLTIVELDWGLGYWPRSVSSELRPDLDNPAAQPNPDIETLTLHFAYYHCVSLVHWAARRHGLRQNVSHLTLPNPIDNVRIVSSIEKSKKAARATLSLLRALPPRQFVDLWRILCYTISATIILLTGVLEDPLSAYARSDVWTIRSFRQFIERVIRENGYDLHRVLQGCLQIEELAQISVDEAEATLAAEGTEGTEERTVTGPWNDVLSRQAQTLREALESSIHPVYMAQGLMTNMQNRDSAATRVFSEVLGISKKDDKQSELFAPECLRPEINGFTFELIAEGSNH